MKSITKFFYNSDNPKITSNRYKLCCGFTLLVGLANLVLGISDAFFYHENEDCRQETKDKIVSYLNFGNGIMLLFFSILSYSYARKLITDSSEQLEINEEQDLKPVDSLMRSCSRNFKISKTFMYKMSAGLTFMFVVADVGLGIYDILLHQSEDNPCNRKTEDKIVAYATIGNAGVLLFFGMVCYLYAKRLMAEFARELSFFSEPRISIDRPSISDYSVDALLSSQYDS